MNLPAKFPRFGKFRFRFSKVWKRKVKYSQGLAFTLQRQECRRSQLENALWAGAPAPAQENHKLVNAGAGAPAHKSRSPELRERMAFFIIRAVLDRLGCMGFKGCSRCAYLISFKFSSAPSNNWRVVVLPVFKSVEVPPM